jgi:UPF0176 protein
LPLVEQVKLRRGKQVGNKVFRKGKSENLLFKHSGALSDLALAKAEKPATIRQKIKIKKVLIGKAEHYFVKAQVGLFIVENQELKTGDKVLISGPTTGNQELILENLFVNGKVADYAAIGDKVTVALPFRIRLSDKLYKILD